MNNEPIDTPRLWFFMDCLFAEQDAVVTARRLFGGAGPYALVVLLCEAYKRFFLRDTPGVVDMSYRTLTHDAGLKDHHEALAVLMHFEAAGIVQLQGCEFPDPFGEDFESATFRLRFLKWSHWTPTRLSDPTNADRQARLRAKRAASQQSGDASLKVGSKVTLDVDGDGDSKGKGKGQAVRGDVVRLSTLLADLILKRDPKARVLPDSKRWLDAVRLLIDSDGRTPAEVEHVIRWCQQDGFWRVNILSTPKLRDKFDQLYAKAGKPKGNADDFFSRNGM